MQSNSVLMVYKTRGSLQVVYDRVNSTWCIYKNNHKVDQFSHKNDCLTAFERELRYSH
jgi:hypothetical protein